MNAIPKDIRLKKKSSRYGVYLPDCKITAHNPIESAPLPERVIISLSQNPGAPCKPLVNKGDRVLTGQKIGDSEEFISAPVHATISGEVSDIITLTDPATGENKQAILLTSDNKDNWIKQDSPANPDELSVKDILSKIREAGIVGLGGAAFPSHAKLSLPEDANIDTLILNGCECEPYITTDHRAMLEYGDKILSGLNIIRKLVSPDKVYIAIEDNKRDAIEHLEGLIASLGGDSCFKITPLETRYPTGAREILIKVLLDKEIPINGRARDIGVVVQNVSTAKAIHDAVVCGRPFIERVVTVTGAVKNPKNLLVRLGTALGSLIDYCGGVEGEDVEIITGGPMTGVSQPDLNAPVNKRTCCLLVKKRVPAKERNCIRCGSCLDVCPMRLEPSVLAMYSKAGRYEDCHRYYIDGCINCGCCTYVCPSNIPILQYIKTAKAELGRKANSATGQR
ncbi:electron transport complex subunit RsxC [Chloroflexota bacterium]